MNDEHTVILVVGRTNSGKTALVKKLCERVGLKNLISYTTRPQRSEQDIDHIFVTEEDYINAKESGNIIAETNIASNYYYATKEQLYKSDTYVIDPNGIEMLKSMDLPNIRFITVYISCPDELREERALKRGDDKSQFRVRSISENAQFRQFVRDEKWDYAISNIDFAKAYSVLRWISDVEGIWKNNQEEKNDYSN